MYYDEYEISIGKETSFCRRVIKDLKASLLKRERQHGMTTEQFLGLPDDMPAPVRNSEIAAWRRDHQQLLEWETRLHDYEEALAALKNQGR